MKYLYKVYGKPDQLLDESEVKGAPPPKVGDDVYVRTALPQYPEREPLANALKSKDVTLRAVARGTTATPSLAVRIAKLASVGVDDVLAGRFPEAGTCAHCGHRADAQEQES